MYVLQGLIICAVIGSNIEWGWTPNPHLAAAIGIFLAWVATMAIVELRAADRPRCPSTTRGAMLLSWSDAAGRVGLVLWIKPEGPAGQSDMVQPEVLGDTMRRRDV